LLACVSFTYVYTKWKGFDKDLVKGDVESLEGKAQLESCRARDGTKYFVKFGHKKFKINSSAFEEFGNNEEYRIYYSAHSRRIISAESVNNT